ncbi:PREDICTED: bZIP transcription factor 2-like [Tarenaya hassleriana]|uniref:bZIP transcription factor 2-like n=1 Tax=Tarenaya hassleriana TaxID=28532 RepID=UPI00053C2240|nr:PREDICTED: bZIP transcription factor 2-like [Tarenaya hassleriana]
MASSSGTYRSSSPVSDGSPSSAVDERKRKRMVSNRESARRSRMRKQKHMDDLTAQINQLTNENRQIMTSLDVTSRLYMTIQAENSVLNAQLSELNTRLRSLDDIIGFVTANTNSSSSSSSGEIDGCGFVDRTVGIHDDLYDDMFSGVNQPWGGSLHANQPIMANDIIMY